MRLLTAITCLPSSFLLLSCSLSNPCADPVEIKAQRRQCMQLQQEMQTARERKNWQVFSTKQDRFQQECERFLYYREDFSDEGLQSCPNRGMPEERNPEETGAVLTTEPSEP